MAPRERGFTLIETVVAVGIGVMLLVAGGVWMLAMRPGALRNAADNFDANLAVARAIAGGSGNGATIAFLPRTGTPGFIMRVYAGRPTASGAVTNAGVMDLVSGAAVSEATFGTPPFAIFLSSAGYATGTARYPNVAAGGSVTFPAIAQQPPCPAGGIVLAFTNAQGAHDTRTLQCNVAIAGTASADPSPTPNAPKLAPSFMLAHWTSDAGPLHFVAAEFGYFHWFASATGDACATQSSDSGAAPATYAIGWPYSVTNATEMASAPAVPGAPYSWPTGDPNDPPATFRLSPVAHDGGLCSVRVVDDYGQEADANVQVMGDLQGSAASLTFASPSDAPQTMTFGKTFDSEVLKLQAGADACAGVVGVVIPAAPAAQATPSTLATQATIVVSPVAAGSCTLLVGDQYGEPTLAIPINVKAAQTLKTWPQQLVLGVGQSSVGTTKSLQPCYALGQTASGSVDTSLPASVSSALGIYVESTGCEVDAADNAIAATNAGMIAYSADGSSETYNVQNTTCSSVAPFGGWSPSPPRSIPDAALWVEGQSAGVCSVTLSNGVSASPAPDSGLIAVNVRDSCAAPSFCLLLAQMDQISTNPLDSSGTLCRGATAVGEAMYSSAIGSVVYPAADADYQWVDWSGNPIVPLGPVTDPLSILSSAWFPVTIGGSPTPAQSAALASASSAFASNMVTADQNDGTGDPTCVVSGSQGFQALVQTQQTSNSLTATGGTSPYFH